MNEKINKFPISKKILYFPCKSCRFRDDKNQSTFANETNADFVERTILKSHDMEETVEKLTSDDNLLKPILFIRNTSRSESDLKSNSTDWTIGPVTGFGIFFTFLGLFLFLILVGFFITFCIIINVYNII